MDLHVVGGFLGSGKTTAIISALRTLIAAGRRVGVITNDKGRFLVDTAFIGSTGVATTEVPGGCFRCNYGDFQDRIEALERDAQPDVLFAESVGSCVDLVGPVLTPLATLTDSVDRHITYSVFVDGRLLRRRLLGLPMPFSENVCYIFDHQLEEAGVLVINKSDLLAREDGDMLAELARQHYPAARVLLQSSLTPAGVAPWLEALESVSLLPAPLQLDYGPYVAGSAELAWLDERLTFVPADGLGREIVLQVVGALLDSLRRAREPLAHVKVLITAGSTVTKVSFTSLDEPGWEAHVPDLPSGPVALLVNARVQAEAASLRDRVTRALTQALQDAGVEFEMGGVTAFAPRVPEP